jgi:type IV secretory pathway TrbL component
MAVMEDRQTKKGGLLIAVLFVLAALKLDGIIDWMWVTILVGPVLIYWAVSLVTTFFAFLAARSLMNRL